MTVAFELIGNSSPKVSEHRVGHDDALRVWIKAAHQALGGALEILREARIVSLKIMRIENNVRALRGRVIYKCGHPRQFSWIEPAICRGLKSLPPERQAKNVHPLADEITNFILRHVRIRIVGIDVLRAIRPGKLLGPALPGRYAEFGAERFTPVNSTPPL